MSRPHFAAWMLSLGLMIFGSGVVSSQNYPNKPIRIVTGGAGGGSDFAARIVAQGISGPLGQPVIVDNQRSAPISMEVGAKMPPDGYNLLVVGEGLWLLPLMQENVTFDAVRDFSPVSLLVTEINIVAVHPSMPVKSVKELIALAKLRPGELNYASGTPGGGPHLAAELLKSMAGVNITRIPYKGSPPSVIALLSGEVQLLIASPNLVMQHAKSGKLRALAVTSAQPSILYPDLPTVAASGLPGYEATGVTGIVAPSKTPAAIINRLNQEIVRILSQPDVKEKFLNSGVEVVASSPEQYAATIKSSIPRMSKVIKDAGIKLE